MIKIIFEVFGVSAIVLFAFTLTFIIMKLLKISIGIRISNEDEEAGIDASSFGVQPYNNE